MSLPDIKSSGFCYRNCVWKTIWSIPIVTWRNFEPCMNTTQFIMITIKLQFNRIIQCTCLPHPTPLSNAIMSLVSGDLRDPSGLKLEDFGDFGKILLCFPEVLCLTCGSTHSFVKVRILAKGIRHTKYVWSLYVFNSITIFNYWKYEPRF